jgi:hypothetical protein
LKEFVSNSRSMSSIQGRKDKTEEKSQKEHISRASEAK